MFHLPYLAGFVDGEGCIRVFVFKRKEGGISTLTSLLRVVNTCRKVLNEFKSVYGGSIYPTTNFKKGWKHCWAWEVRKDNLERVLRDIAPYLKIKKKHARLALKAIKHMNKNNYRGRGRVPEKVLAYRLRLVREYSALNRKGE